MIIFVHLLNDRSGSPRVLKSVIDEIGDLEPGMLFLGSDGDGILSEIRIDMRRYWYRRSAHRALTLITFFISQVALFIKLIRTRGVAPNAVIYINTLLPFGAALYGRLTRRPVVYHVHEVSLSPRIFQRFLTAIARMTAARLIYVSDTHRALLPIVTERSFTLYNIVDKGLAAKAAQHTYTPWHDDKFIVLMLAANRRYKGIPEFLALAERLAGYDDIAFHLVLSDGVRPAEYSSVPSNVTILPPTGDPSAYYSKASIVLNLSRPDQWIETFGLTLLEGMAFGLPVIAPPVGGPAELVQDGTSGFLIDCRNTQALVDAITMLAHNEAQCTRMSAAARERASKFDRAAFHRGLISVLEAARG